MASNCTRISDPPCSISTAMTKNRPRVIWCWRETISQMKRHSLDEIVGDPKDCWIAYGHNETNILEGEYQVQNTNHPCSLGNGYVVDLLTMKQRKVSTGYERDVQRLDNRTKANRPSLQRPCNTPSAQTTDGQFQEQQCPTCSLMIRCEVPPWGTVRSAWRTAGCACPKTCGPEPSR